MIIAHHDWGTLFLILLIASMFGWWAGVVAFVAIALVHGLGRG